MALFGDSAHTRLVAWARIVLPLASIAILSSLFLFSKSHDPMRGVRMFEGDLAAFAERERITAPRFAGMTTEGIAIQLSAREAGPRPGQGPVFDALEIEARVDLPDGNSIDVIANRGTIDALEQMAELTEEITLETSRGFTARTFGLSFALDRLDIRSQGAISGSGPLGELSAGAMRLFRDTGAESSGYLLVFKGGVKLVYRPK